MVSWPELVDFCFLISLSGLTLALKGVGVGRGQRAVLNPAFSHALVSLLHSSLTPSLMHLSLSLPPSLPPNVQCYTINTLLPQETETYLLLRTKNDWSPRYSGLERFHARGAGGGGCLFLNCDLNNGTHQALCVGLTLP
jgi:hypothetical protein